MNQAKKRKNLPDVTVYCIWFNGKTERIGETAPGCIWLRARFQDLLEQLAPGNVFQGPDRFRAVRLLGRQPAAARTERTIALIYVASNVLHRDGITPFDDLLGDLDAWQLRRFQKKERNKDRDDLNPKRMPDEGGRVGRRRAQWMPEVAKDSGMPVDVDLSWAYEDRLAEVSDTGNLTAENDELHGWIIRVSWGA